MRAHGIVGPWRLRSRRGRFALLRTLRLLAILAAASAAAGDDAPGLRGFLAVQGERVLASENADLAMTPGSVLKLTVTAAAVHHLGLEHRVVTVLRGSVPLSQGTLAGDLVVVAAGDPTWNVRFFATDPRSPLHEIARQLHRRGLRRVTGDLLVDRSRFPGRGAALSRPAAELAYAYGAPASALAVDENTTWVEIAPGNDVGDPARLRALAGAERFEWTNHMRTVTSARHERGTVDFQQVWGTARIVVRGEYPVSEPSYRVAMAVPDPDRHAGLALREALAAAGIVIAGEVRLVDRPWPTARGEVLARLASPPLGELLETILADSHNFYAEMLLRLLAAEILGEGRDDEALELVASFLAEEVGVGDEACQLDDGSGLSPYSLLSPEAVVALLRWIYRQSWRDAYLAALARPGIGTLRAWGRLPPGLAAKTGSIRGSLGIAGYLKDRGGEPVIFAAFLGHRQEEAPVLRAELAAWLWRLAKGRLPELSRRPGGGNEAASRSRDRSPPPG